MLRVHVDFHYEYDKLDARGTAVLTDFLRGLETLGIAADVAVIGSDTPPVITRAKRAGGNGRDKKAAAPVPAAEPVVDLGGDPGTEGDEDPLDEELSAGGLSPTEALERALAGARQIYNHGFRKEIQTLQRECGVAKFADVPADKGHEFLARVLRLAEQTGVHV